MSSQHSQPGASDFSALSNAGLTQSPRVKSTGGETYTCSYDPQKSEYSLMITRNDSASEVTQVRTSNATNNTDLANFVEASVATESRDRVLAILKESKTQTRRDNASGPSLYEVLVIEAGAEIGCGYNPYKSEYTINIPDGLGGVLRKEVLSSKASQKELETFVEKHVPVSAARAPVLAELRRSKRTSDAAANAETLAAIQARIRAMEARLAR